MKRADKEALVNFLSLPEVKDFYSQNGGMQQYSRFLELIKNVNYAHIYMKFKGDSNSFMHFLVTSRGIKNFNGLKENNLEFFVERIMTGLSADGNYFYDLYYDAKTKVLSMQIHERKNKI